MSCTLGYFAVSVSLLSLELDSLQLQPQRPRPPNQKQQKCLQRKVILQICMHCVFQLSNFSSKVELG